ncbi:probable RNA-binding protein 19 [Sciurus carolinensis]|uniref:probable RNA-binding protein 19 n=1 Tax=Sciurus carolinensis TaxID=30640 RepID=UPI001FB405CF|nr:probable RNA-binding protein 19 [Sciurus carolinensis]
MLMGFLVWLAVLQPEEFEECHVCSIPSTFWELKMVHLPKKMNRMGTHRGFSFMDFFTKQDAKRPFNTLCHSTHLYSQRLVLEWANSKVTLQVLQRKMAEQFHGSLLPPPSVLFLACRSGFLGSSSSWHPFLSKVVLLFVSVGFISRSLASARRSP